MRTSSQLDTMSRFVTGIETIIMALPNGKEVKALVEVLGSAGPPTSQSESPQILLDALGAGPIPKLLWGTVPVTI